MTRTNSVLSLILILSALLAAGLACGGSDTSTGNTTAGNTAAPAPAAPAPAAPKNIAGAYNATGTNVDGGGEYKADLTVTGRDEVYQFSWASGGQSYDGVGVMSDNTVAVAYTEGTNGKGCGVVLYKINADGSLDGKSGYWGVNSAESEKAVRTKGSDLEGNYDITGTNPDGKKYDGKLAVSKSGDGYTFAWTAGSSFQGFGVRTGDKVAVGFGGDQCAFVSYEVKPDGMLDGKWGGKGSKSFGTEVAKKK